MTTADHALGPPMLLTDEELDQVDGAMGHLE